MTKEEILEAITEREWLDYERRISRSVLSPQKLATFLADLLVKKDV